MAVNRFNFRLAIGGLALVGLSACEQTFDFDLRNLGSGFNTSNAAQSAVATRPAPDDRGILSYPNYQVAVARRGDTLADVAARVGLPAAELARYNGIPAGTQLRQDEIVALPRRVSEPSLATGAITDGPILPAGQVDVTTIAATAIERAAPADQPTTAAPKAQTGKEPIRHQIERGETAFSIARLYDVSVRSLADWNGLGTDLAVREGQYLLIPVAQEDPPKRASAPGEGTDTPEPPSAETPLPDAEPTVAITPDSPNLGDGQTAASDGAKLVFPVNGKIIRSFVKKKNDGIDIAAAPGTPVKAAAAGTVAAITRDTDQIPILVLRHADNLLTVYAGVDGVSVKKGDKVKRGQTIAKIRAAEPSFLHFEVRQGFDSVDPMPFLN
jgi:murein DD-endopeptidase MepM/ murein hydrolase activator NlpD